MNTAERSDTRVISSPEELRSQTWPTGTVVQEIHTGNCCQAHEFMCDLHPPQWEMTAEGGWTRSGRRYDPDQDEPRLPLHLLWHPAWTGQLMPSLPDAAAAEPGLTPSPQPTGP